MFCDQEINAQNKHLIFRLLLGVHYVKQRCPCLCFIVEGTSLKDVTNLRDIFKCMKQSDSMTLLRWNLLILKNHTCLRERKKKRKLIWYWSKYKMQSGTKGTYLDIKSNFCISYQILKVEFFWYNWINGFLLLLFGSPNKK